MDTKDICWIAGLLEGEGYFGMRKSGGYKGTPVIQLQMTDRDIVSRASELFKSKLYGPHGPYGAGKKKTWQTMTFGSNAVGWMMTIYQIMGERRRKKIDETLAIWRTMQTILPSRQPSCHPNRTYHAKDLCKPCYRHDYYVTNANLAS